MVLQKSIFSWRMDEYLKALRKQRFFIFTPPSDILFLQAQIMIE